MANKSLTDLTARTATADSDLLHINSGGTDYKQSKSDFMHGSLARNFEVTSALTSQVDALPIDASYFGCIWNYGHVSVTGMPINALSYVKAVRANSDQFAYIEAWSALDPDGQHYIVCKNNGTWESSWTKCASKAEITSLNNSLTTLSGQINSGGGTFGFRYMYGQQNQTTIYGGASFARVRRQHIFCVYADQNSVRKIFTIFVGENGALASQTNAVVGTDYYSVSVSGNDIIISTLGNWGNGYAIGLI